ncbi:MAG TPA: GlsB/YeaQ/YmgE family stress response membrane protein [Vicinamibacterales bacterium]|nr:GlsB/YeaQ/YmgE family stress response membrane protein [Vicinamibacterales bacterium]
MLEALRWMIFGLIVGAIAKLLMPGKDPGGIIVTMALGIAGSLIGGFIGRTLGWYGPNASAGYIVSTLGAVLLLWIYRMVVARRAV